MSIVLSNFIHHHSKKNMYKINQNEQSATHDILYNIQNIKQSIVSIEGLITSVLRGPSILQVLHYFAIILLIFAFYLQYFAYFGIILNCFRIFTSYLPLGIYKITQVQLYHRQHLKIGTKHKTHNNKKKKTRQKMPRIQKKKNNNNNNNKKQPTNKTKFVCEKQIARHVKYYTYIGLTLSSCISYMM